MLVVRTRSKGDDMNYEPRAVLVSTTKSDVGPFNQAPIIEFQNLLDTHCSGVKIGKKVLLYLVRLKF